MCDSTRALVPLRVIPALQASGVASLHGDTPRGVVDAPPPPVETADAGK